MRPPGLEYFTAHSKMMLKAERIASAALEHIIQMYPADAPQFAELVRTSRESLIQLAKLRTYLLDLEHEQKTAFGGGKCTCTRCSEESLLDRAAMDAAVETAVASEITGVEVVYDAEVPVDTTGPAEESGLHVPVRSITPPTTDAESQPSVEKS